LQQAGFNAFGVGTGSGTLALAKQDKPDVVILDVNLPDISGFDVCRQLKADPDTSGIPVLFLTATEKNESGAETAKGVGGIAYLFEPIEAETLVTMVKFACGMKSLRAGAGSVDTSSKDELTHLRGLLLQVAEASKDSRTVSLAMGGVAAIDEALVRQSGRSPAA
jgi:DNA-binding response OmpR family regulator